MDIKVTYTDPDLDLTVHTVKIPDMARYKLALRAVYARYTHLTGKTIAQYGQGEDPEPAEAVQVVEMGLDWAEIHAAVKGGLPTPFDTLDGFLNEMPVDLYQVLLNHARAANPGVFGATDEKKVVASVVG